ncbi:PREDICTED: cytochrome P450 9e2-like [Ceratosolen solmsi marchali]|uniref:Cytochrome P450 9e2-like n=1 Tax=Ceratosolen solmsi marchali TaxID=326594 RepID=A0AAJ6YW35_9HYME|nr:PREDICTED: cytochrome P450 9e2-like [Ceratosolen solmsi marchali]
MEIFTLSLLLIVCYSLYYYFNKQLRFFHDKNLPYKSGWPLFGNFFYAFLRRKHMLDIIEEIYKVNSEAKYIGGFNFTKPVFVIRDLDLIKNITIKNFDHFQDHRTFFDANTDKIMGGNVFNLKGDVWRESRNLLSPVFTSKKMKAMFELMVDCGERFVNYLEKQSEESRKIVDTKNLFTKFTNDVIATCAFGITVDSLKNPENDFYVLGRKVTNFEGQQMLKFLIAGAFPKLIKWLKIKFVDDKTRIFFENIVSTTIALRDAKGISRPDMLQHLIDSRNKDYKHFTLDMTYITAQLFIFFFGGFETTSSQMCIIAHELAINPDIQKRLQNEIDKVLEETNGRPTYEAITEMAYLDAIFNESLRLHTQGGIIDRVCTKAFELPPALPDSKPFSMQPGMNIWIPASAIHRDPNYYENPTKFDPDRYFQKKVSINDVFNLGFGIGPRSCIGNRFALLETKILIFSLLSKFNLKPNAKTCSPFKYSAVVFNIKPVGGYTLSIECRNK